MSQIYIICAVRNAPSSRVAEIRKYADSLRATGLVVHFPPDDAQQDDPVGNAICSTHLAAMKAADEVHVFWDVTSAGSHFDLGMAYALGKKIVPIDCEYPDSADKSYWKAIISTTKETGK